MNKLYFILIVFMLLEFSGCENKAEYHNSDDRKAKFENKMNHTIDMDTIDNLRKEFDDKIKAIKIIDKSANVKIGKFSVPIGSFIPWIPPSDITSLEEAKKHLPEDFRICNKTYVQDDPKTEFDETRIPNLSTDKSFTEDKIIYVIRVN